MSLKIEQAAKAAARAFSSTPNTDTQIEFLLKHYKTDTSKLIRALVKQEYEKVMTKCTLTN